MTNPDLHQFWQTALTDWQASGLSGAAFCKAEALSYHRFVYWRGKLKTTGSRKDKQAPSGFTRVAPMAGSGLRDGLTVSLPGGLSITGLHAGNIDLLGPILRQL